MKTTTQTPSTKCQYHETISMPGRFSGGHLVPQRKAEHDEHDDHAGGHVQAMKADQRVVSGAKQIATDREVMPVISSRHS